MERVCHYGGARRLRGDGSSYSSLHKAKEEMGEIELPEKRPRVSGATIKRWGDATGPRL